MGKQKILIIGANGQIGTELTVALRERAGTDNVFATDIREPNAILAGNGPYDKLDVLDKAALKSFIQKQGITQVYNMAAVLSATGEKDPAFAWKLNMEGLLNTLDIAVDLRLKRVFWPSSIAAFGPNTPKKDTPQYAVMDPTTVYGISKLAGEGWCDYYHRKKGLDVRSLRYPGLISYKAPPGGGTTDYAIEIFYDAKKTGRYQSFIAEGTRLPMMYMPDAIRGTIELMEAPAKDLTVRTSYNFSSLDFTPAELATAIQKQVPGFTLTYAPDFRDELAQSWPQSIDDTIARLDWKWQHEYGLDKMTSDMLKNINP